MTVIARQSRIEPRKITQKWLFISAWLLTAVAILPLVFQWRVPQPRKEFTQGFIIALRCLLATGICYWVYRIERKRLARLQAIVVAYLTFALTIIVNIAHHLYIDRGSYFPNVPNIQWQVSTQQSVMQLVPGA
jgi:uncharacterized membrane protein